MGTFVSTQFFSTNSLVCAFVSNPIFSTKTSPWVSLFKTEKAISGPQLLRPLATISQTVNYSFSGHQKPTNAKGWWPKKGIAFGPKISSCTFKMWCFLLPQFWCYIRKSGKRWISMSFWLEKIWRIFVVFKMAVFCEFGKRNVFCCLIEF